MRCFLIILLLAFSGTSSGQPIRVAVAANAQFVLKIIQADYKKKTGLEVEIISGSSGKLTAQIKNGAPYDVFLSADMDLPRTLYKSGLGLTLPKVYALGSLIVCSTKISDLENWPKLIQQSSISKIAIANPKLAPYGQAAEATLRHYNLWNPVQSKLVYGESIAQVNTYITTGAVKVGFTTEAFIYENQNKSKLYWARVNSKVYSPIQQGVIVLTYAKKKNYHQVMKFYQYLFSSSAQQLFRQYGYNVP